MLEHPSSPSPKQRRIERREPWPLAPVVCPEGTVVLPVSKEHGGTSPQVLEQISALAADPSYRGHPRTVFIPGKRYSREEVERLLPACSVLLDGSCDDETFIHERHVSVNDHRFLAEQSTSSQTRALLGTGKLDFLYDDDGTFSGILILNHRDQDNILAEYLLRNGKREFSQQEQARLGALVALENTMDQALGAYPLRQREAEQMKWVFAPIRHARMQEAGGWLLEDYTPEQMEEAVEECQRRIEEYVQGRAERKALNEEQVQPLYRGAAGSWGMYPEGEDTRLTLARRAKLEDIDDRGFVIFLGRQPSGQYRYTIGNLSQGQRWAHEPPLFDMLALQRFLNEHEQRVGKGGHWGGGEKTASNHGTESAFAPAELTALLDDFLRTHKPSIRNLQEGTRAEIQQLAS